MSSLATQILKSSGLYSDEVLERVAGTINDAPEVINALNVDAVVIACIVSDEWLKVVKDILAPTGVKVTRFSFAETPV